MKDLTSVRTIALAGLFSLFSLTTVSAKDRSELLQDVPMAITAISGDELVSDTIPSIPNMLVQTGKDVLLGGKVANRPNNLALNPTYTVFVPRIEVLRQIPTEQAEALLGNTGALSNFLDGMIIPYSWDLLDRDFIQRQPQTDPNAEPETLTCVFYARNLRGHPMEIKIVDDATTKTVTVNGVALTGRAAYARNGCVFEVEQPIYPPPTFGEWAASQENTEFDPSVSLSLLEEAGWIKGDDGYYSAPDQFADSNPERTFFLPTNNAWTATTDAGFDPLQTGAYTGVQIGIIEQITGNTVAKGYVDFRNPTSVANAANTVRSQAGALTGLAGAGIYYDRDLSNGNTNLGIQAPRPALNGSPAIVTQEGLVYTIPEVLYPPGATVDDIINGDPDLQEVRFFRDLAGYDFKTGTTLWAPNNNAYRSNNERVGQFFANTQIVTETNQYLEMNSYGGGYGSQVWTGNRVNLEDNLWGTCAGSAVVVVNGENGPTVNGANIERTNIVARDGIIHVVDQIFDPVQSIFSQSFKESHPEYSLWTQGLEESGYGGNAAIYENSQYFFFPVTNETLQSAGFGNLQTDFENEERKREFFGNFIVNGGNYEPPVADDPNASEVDFFSWEEISPRISLTYPVRGGAIGKSDYAGYYGQVYSREVETVGGAPVEFTHLDGNFTVGASNTVLTPTMVGEGVFLESTGGIPFDEKPYEWP